MRDIERVGAGSTRTEPGGLVSPRSTASSLSDAYTGSVQDSTINNHDDVYVPMVSLLIFDCIQVQGQTGFYPTFSPYPQYFPPLNSKYCRAGNLSIFNFSNTSNNIAHYNLYNHFRHPLLHFCHLIIRSNNSVFSLFYPHHDNNFSSYNNCHRIFRHYRILTYNHNNNRY